jgi:hypothetical protein
VLESISAEAHRCISEHGFRSPEFRRMFDIVEFRHLRYIAAIAETANFTRAAEKLFLEAVINFIPVL